MRTIPTLTLILLTGPALLWAQPTSITEKGLTPDPDIFDGTFSENWERDQEQIPYARIGETSYGNSLEGKENNVKGWVTEKGENSEGQGQDPQRQGRGLGQEGEPEDEGGGNQEDNSIEVTEQPEAGGGGQSEQQKQQQSGGGNSDMEPPQGMQNAGGGGSQNPLEMLKKITSMAQSKNQSQSSTVENMEGGEEGEGTFGNNPHQVEVAKQNADVLGSNRQEAEKPDKNGAEHRSAAAGRQEKTRNEGSETGDDLPSGI